MKLDFTTEPVGEARKAESKEIEPLVVEQREESPNIGERLMEEVCQQKNCVQALKKVRANKGSSGIDGMTVEELPGYLKEHWPTIRKQLLEGCYKPKPVLRVEIPKPDGGIRKLGIPTVLDRFIQQASMQVLQSRWEPTFSKASYGFRPQRSAHQAIAEAQRHARAGYLWVVDMDLEKFFDRVNHDKLMATLARRITDKRMLRLIRAFLKAGVMEEGLVSPSEEGTPQGGPLSPLLSNIVLDALDKELERRKHRFVRYADDCNIYVRSQKAGERVMESVSKYITEKLRLKVNAAKSAVGRPWERKFLGFNLVITYHGAIARGISAKALERMKERIRELTRGTKGRSVQQIISKLRLFLNGWGRYYGYCQTTGVLENLDQWIRRRLRSYYWRQWKNGRRKYAELRKRKLGSVSAKKLAGSSHGPWRLSRTPQIHKALPNSHFDSIGLPRLVTIRPF